MPGRGETANKIMDRALDAGRVLAARLRPVPAYEDMGPEFAADYAHAAEFTMSSRERMFALWLAVRYITAANIPGDVVECGVWQGGSSMLAAAALRHNPRTLWLYDTFEGMPAPSDKDRNWTGETAADRLAAQDRTEGPDWAYATLADVQANMRSTGYPAEHIRFVEGMVEDTIPAQLPETIALLRLDTDWYESTRHELEQCWPRLSPGGVLIVDDYGHWQGARQATDEYFAGKPVLLNRIDYTGRIAVKAQADAS